MAVKIALIVALNADRAIGRDNTLPWRIPGDLKYFKATTMGKPLVMGRKTFESLPGGPLPGRTNIVISRNPDFAPDGVVVARSLDDALDKAKAEAEATGADEVMVMGGAQIYQQTIERADRLYLTEVECPVDGADAFFPRFDDSLWRESSNQAHPAEGNTPAHTYRVLERVG